MHRLRVLPQAKGISFYIIVHNLPGHSSSGQITTLSSSNNKFNNI